MIRAAKLSDAGSINALSAHFGYTRTSPKITRVRLKQLIDSHSDWVWVAEHASKIIGWIHVFTAQRLASESFIEIGGLVVEPKMRKQGVGRALLEFATRQSAEQNLALRVRCNIQRHEACQFYASGGFVHTKTQHIFEKPGASE